MTILLSCLGLTKTVSHRPLFEELSLTVSRGDHIGLIGPNGSGKSTLLKILCGMESANSGEVIAKQGLRISYVPQQATYPEVPLEEILIQQKIPGDNRLLAATVILSKLGFSNPQQLASTLSGGWKKRFDIAKALVIDPDLVLLDEPTNHLDLTSIGWLEGLLQRAPWSFIAVSHDRLFLERITNRVIELNSAFPKGLFAVDGNYRVFLERRADYLEHREQYEQGLKSKLRGEIAWLRQSPAARTTKQQARIQSAERLQKEFSDLKSRKAPIQRNSWQFEEGGVMARQLLVARNLTKNLGGRTLFKKLDITLSPGTRLGIAGNNGCGKTTLLRILAGEVKPDAGTIKCAEGIRIAYFDQHRIQLSPTDTLRQALSPNGDTVFYRGKPIHVNGWARRFHFGEERLLLPVGELSGGERARITLAHLMLQPADLLLLDEPTNDLDIETLELLESSLEEFPGAVVLITHDRQMLDNISTELIGFECGDENYYFADVAQWEEAKNRYAATLQKSTTTSDKGTTRGESRLKKKLSYREQKELDELQVRIEKAENEVSMINESLTTPKENAEMTNLCSRLHELQLEIDTLYSRWQELENSQV